MSNLNLHRFSLEKCYLFGDLPKCMYPFSAILHKIAYYICEGKWEKESIENLCKNYTDLLLNGITSSE